MVKVVAHAHFPLKSVRLHFRDAQMLSDSGVFAGVEYEMSIWLDCLPPTGWRDLALAAVTCLDDAACSIAQDPYVHSDRVAMMAAAASQSAEVCRTMADCEQSLLITAV